MRQVFVARGASPNKITVVIGGSDEDVFDPTRTSQSATTAGSCVSDTARQNALLSMATRAGPHPTRLPATESEVGRSAVYLGGCALGGGRGDQAK
jgi:hypothetical protein